MNAIVLTEVYAYAANGRSAFMFDKQALLDNWDDFAAQKGDLKGYVNPLCRPRNMPESALAHAKRVAVDAEWSGAEQWVGKNHRVAHAHTQGAEPTPSAPGLGQAHQDGAAQ